MRSLKHAILQFIPFLWILGSSQPYGPLDPSVDFEIHGIARSFEHFRVHSSTPVPHQRQKTNKKFHKITPIFLKRGFQKGGGWGQGVCYLGKIPK